MFVKRCGAFRAVVPVLFTALSVLEIARHGGASTALLAYIGPGAGFAFLGSFLA